MKILVVDDDKNICDIIGIYLKPEGYTLKFCHDGSSALEEFRKDTYDLVILDHMLPGLNGREVCRLIREESEVPIILLTALGLTADKVKGFGAGADDYLVKPFEPEELVARVMALLRRKGRGKQEETICLGELTVDMKRYEASVNGRFIDLKPKELQLLWFFIKNRNIVFSREQLLEKVWGYDFMGETRTVDVHVKMIREKLEKAGASVNLKTIWGVGYKLEAR